MKESGERREDEEISREREKGEMLMSDRLVEERFKHMELRWWMRYYSLEVMCCVAPPIQPASAPVTYIQTTSSKEL